VISLEILQHAAEPCGPRYNCESTSKTPNLMTIESKHDGERQAVDREIDLLFARYDDILAADVSSVARIKLLVALRDAIAPLAKRCSSRTRHYAALAAQRARVTRLNRLIGGHIGELLLIALEKGERLPGRRRRTNGDLPFGLTRRYASYWLGVARLARRQEADFEQRLDAALLADPRRGKTCAQSRKYHAARKKRIMAGRLAEERRQEEQRRDAGERQRAQRRAAIAGHAKNGAVRLARR
jgi:hypothetical protein